MIEFANASVHDLPAFEAALRADGYLEVLTRDAPANSHVESHTHPFDVRALMLAGELTLACGDNRRVFRAGDVFIMKAGTPHSEQFGSAPARYLVGRRRV